MQTEGSKDYKPAPIAADMNRFENGEQTTNVPVMGNPAMSGAEQLDKGIFKGLTIDHRRFPVVDRENGVVLGIMLMHAQMNGQMGGILIAEMFKVAGRKIHQVQAVMVNVAERFRHRLEMMAESLSLSRRMVRAARGLTMDQLPPEVVAKVKIGLLDFLSCAFEARDLPWGCQAIRMAERGERHSDRDRNAGALVAGGSGIRECNARAWAGARGYAHGRGESSGRGDFSDAAGARAAAKGERPRLHPGCGVRL